MATNFQILPLSFRDPWQIDDIPCLFTIGYEGRTINNYIEILLTNNIRVLIDVRKNPLSRKPGFSKSAFQSHLKSAGIIYYHLPELGVPSALRKNLGSIESYKILFNYYEKEVLSFNKDLVEEIKLMVTRFSRIALTCYEADFQTCHRHKITEYLIEDQSFNTRIVHLM